MEIALNGIIPSLLKLVFEALLVCNFMNAQDVLCLISSLDLCLNFFRNPDKLCLVFLSEFMFVTGVLLPSRFRTAEASFQ